MVGCNKSEIHSSGWISAWKGQFHSVFFVLINVMQIRREFSLKKKKKEKDYFLINKILLSDVSWRWRGDLKGCLIAACSNLFALLLYHINPILQGFYCSSAGARKDLFLTLLAWFSFWFWDSSFLILFPLKQWKLASDRNRMLSKAFMLLVVLKSPGCLVDRSFHALC